MRKWILLTICNLFLLDIENKDSKRNYNTTKLLLRKSQILYFCLFKEISLTNVESNLHTILCGLMHNQEYERIYFESFGCSTLQDVVLSIIKRYCKISKFFILKSHFFLSIYTNNYIYFEVWNLRVLVSFVRQRFTIYKVFAWGWNRIFMRQKQNCIEHLIEKYKLIWPLRFEFLILHPTALLDNLFPYLNHTMMMI